MCRLQKRKFVDLIYLNFAFLFLAVLFFAVGLIPRGIAVRKLGLNLSFGADLLAILALVDLQQD